MGRDLGVTGGRIDHTAILQSPGFDQQADQEQSHAGFHVMHGDLVEPVGHVAHVSGQFRQQVAHGAGAREEPFPKVVDIDPRDGHRPVAAHRAHASTAVQGGQFADDPSRKDAIHHHLLAATRRHEADAPPR